MTELDRLPPDQRAVLSLVLDRGKSYAEVASMLAIPEATVRERAHAALDALARAAGAGGSATRAATTAAPASAADTAPTPHEPRGSEHSHTHPLPSSRLGGAVLLVGLVVAIVVAVVLLSSGGKGSGKSSNAGNTTATSTNPTSTSAPSSAKARIDTKLTLSPVEPESGGGGEAYVLSDGSRRAFYVAAHGLPPSSHGFFYAVWLYNSPSSSAPLGRAPTVGSNGRLEGGGPLPSNAGDYAKLIVTRETNTRARHPGAIVLSGNFSLH